MMRAGNTSNVLVAGLAGLAIGSMITGTILRVYKTPCKKEVKDKEEGDDYDVNSAISNDSRELPPEIREEQLSRNTLYFGEEGMKKIKGSNVLVVGLGGVGSHTAHMLARAGVGYLRLIDFDQVTVSSLNRHACATLKDVGIPKVIALERFLKQVCPDSNFLQIDARVQMYTGDASKDGSLLEGKDWDFVVDAIDDVPTKARLLAHCAKHKIRVISCMGAGGKSDITRLHISNLKSASRDPLASKLRQTIRRLLPKNGEELSCLEDVDQLATLYSSEKTVVKLAEITPEQKEQGIHNFGAVDNMRIRVMPVLGTMPAVMGQSLAAYVLCELGNKPFNPMAGERVGRNVRHKLFQHLKNREKAIRQKLEAENGTSTNDDDDDSNQNEGKMIGKYWVGPVQVDIDDMEYILAEIWRNRCCVTGDTLGTVLELARWDLSKPSNCQNLVVMGAKALAKFDELLPHGTNKESIPIHIQQRIEARLATARIDSKA